MAHYEPYKSVTLARHYKGRVPQLRKPWCNGYMNKCRPSPVQSQLPHATRQVPNLNPPHRPMPTSM
eukprot:CAMPEP_0181240632 /NCGR_PEP_ID=MMETSP1096-20121128/40645_1 /TAXON_ID=156174 ORGANISM="Chrysochromulina ericina, Strain CCMP281" /NCGR_SAMPLE_ID=MMETSP1096 /ASSEMBLY_ACC=CAM_ASM_000453 /LENGTH=65 /DNA_ID=CAMNT_0023336557 /DNA_START=632 /DNA_END=829 /DNA_ORIENTATION=+